MMIRNIRKIIVCTKICFLYITLLDAQTYQFKNYGPDSKIPNGFVYTLNQDASGYLWVGTGAGLARFDGFEFYKVPFPDSLTGRFPVTSYDDRGGTLWFGCNDGSVWYYSEGDLKSLNVDNSKTISQIIGAPDGSVWIIPQGGSVFRIKTPAMKVTRFFIEENVVMFSGSFTESGDLLLGTQESIKILRINGDSLSAIDAIEEFDYSAVNAIHKVKDNDIWIAGTNGNGLFKVVLSGAGYYVERLTSNPELDFLVVQSIFEDHENNLWISTNESGILKIRVSGEDHSVESMSFIDESSGLPGNNVKVVYQDSESDFWIGMIGDGLSLLNSLAFSFYSPGLTPETNNIIYVNSYYKTYFLGTPAGFWLFNPEDNKNGSFTDLRQRTGKYEITSWCVDERNDIWIGTNGGGLFLRNSNGNIIQYYRSGESGEDYITDIEADNKYLWLATLNGVIIIDRKTGLLKGQYNINNGLPYNSINQIRLTADGRCAVATKTERLYLVDPESGVTSGKAIMYGTTMNSITSFDQSSDGNLWVSTAGNGVFEFYGDSLRSFTRADLLMSDYCYSILADSSDKIWIGHVGGISLYDRTKDVMSTFGTEFARGGACNPDGMYKSTDGKIFIGTNQGIIIYDRQKDSKVQTAPFNNINQITINDITYPYKPSFTLPYRKSYTITVNYTGINFRNSEKVYYQTRLENWSDEWSKWTTEREVTLSPRDGKYRFIMNSVNDEGLSGDPVTFDLLIKKPFWRTWWFILAAIAAITGLIIIIIREREKAQKKLELYLKTELEARTSEVMKQKGVLELQNIEITDSINYAKRIQTSILPDFNKLNDMFRDTFLFFLPRDIVSGDFYWFEKINDDRLILVCADSTGHGVPGAFMSMIGSTLLQDIVSRQHITVPSRILKLLDRQIFSTLNQNSELGIANDGMDMVVCDINIREGHLKFASAMRPVILVIDGESYYIKGNRWSIGGESVTEKFFDDQEYYLHKGDTLYMFSDGMPDQFGGKGGKKMKIIRLKKLIEEVSELSMSDQKEIITKFYNDWKGDFEQVDDILLMGIRF